MKKITDTVQKGETLAYVETAEDRIPVRATIDGLLRGLIRDRDAGELSLPDREAEPEQYISEKLKQAEWALQCISRRENTLREVAECIVRRQHTFFVETHGQLVPLRMMDVAEELGIHESTVSRAVKGKYLQCERGVFLLDTFFSQAMAGADGAVSADSIKEKLKMIIAAEDKKKKC